ncbi:MFS transporter [Zeimonas arvi]|uniref:MFS transporter n=1 Tax=Zeimonas arvi TaxID=2498847 RepID=A0A5C8NMX2_9BURK|nr:MFS transporter [Zeimonas arvi]TXL62430.1 MFS transporter [Zeimonas arvi]
MLAIVVGLTASVLQSGIVNLALPDIARELEASAASAIWVINAFQLGTLVMLLPLAAFGDRAGYRRVYLAGLALFTLASFAAMLADSIGMLIAARAVQGLGAAGVLSVNTALVRQIHPPALLGRGMAILSMVVATSAVAGPSVAAAILSVGDWPWLFAVNLPVGAAAFFLARSALPADRPPPADADAGSSSSSSFPVGDVLMNILMFSLVFIGAQRLGVHAAAGQEAPWLAWGLLAAGLAVGAVYLRRQARRDAPMFPVDLLRIPAFSLSMGTSICAFCAQALAYVSLPFLMLESYGRSHLDTGLLITAWPLAIVVLAPVAGRLIGRVPDGLLAGSGLGILAVGLALLATLPTQPDNADIVWRMLICGAGFGLFQTPNNHAIVTSSPRHRSGAASGMLGTARITGQTVGAVILAAIFSAWGRHDGSAESAAMLIASGFAAGAAVFSVLRVRPRRPA